MTVDLEAILFDEMILQKGKSYFLFVSPKSQKNFWIKTSKTVVLKTSTGIEDCT